MSSIDEQFVEFVVKSLVNKPDAVKVERRIDEKGVLLELTVDPEDLGRVIGKRGATAQSLRTLLRALGTKNDARYNLKIIDNGVGGPNHSNDDARDDSASQDFHGPQPHVDDVVADEPADSTDEPEEQPVAPEPETEVSVDHDDHDSVVSKTRKELEELDDL